MKKTKNFTCKEIIKILGKYKYLRFRSNYGFTLYINSRVMIRMYKLFYENRNHRTYYNSYEEVSFHEYITNKVPFFNEMCRIAMRQKKELV
jgi:hypothetical protein